jgi:hypothetical protein
MSSLSNILSSVNKGFLKDFLTGAGLTLATSGATLIVFNQMLNQFKGNLGSVPQDMLALAHIAGFDIFFSLVLGAYVTRFTLGAGKLSLTKK